MPFAIIHLDVFIEENFGQCFQSASNVRATGEVEKQGGIDAKTERIDFIIYLLNIFYIVFVLPF